MLILLTDGRNNAGALSPLQAAEAAKTLGVTVYTVGVGATESRRRGLFQARSEEIDEKTLTQIAEATGGQYFRGTSSEGLATIYSTIDRLEKSTAEIKEFVHREELFHKALLPGLLCLLLQLLLSQTLLRRLP